MSFISIEFYLILPFSLLFYFLTPSSFRWIPLIVFSMTFYGFYNISYVPLIIFSAFIDFYCCLKMSDETQNSKRKLWLLLSVFANLSILSYFKYWNFFIVNANAIGFDFSIHNVLLPLGISFYTLQTMSYSIDVYRKKTIPCRHFGLFFAYVSYFPQLVAGPIERASALLPQLTKANNPTAKHITDGLKLILFGLFLKLGIADNMVVFIDSVYTQPTARSSALLWVTGFLLHFKIYCDFWAYSEIARGIAKLMGIELSVNFNRPYFAANLRSFWQKWHISLTRWIGDYLHKPLTKRYGGNLERALITLLVLAIVGFWHGASWNFILFGLWNGLIIVFWNPVSGFCIRFFGLGPLNRRLIGHLVVLFSCFVSGTLFHLSDPVTLTDVLKNMLIWNSVDTNYTEIQGKLGLLSAAFLSVLLITLSFIAESRKVHELEVINSLYFIHRYGILAVMAISILLLGDFSRGDFVYFVF